MAEPLDNPASRLLAIIKDGQGHDARKNCREVWRTVLHLPESSNAHLLSRIALVGELPAKIVQEMLEKHPEQMTMVRYWETQVEQAFKSQNLNAEWTHFIGAIDNHSINYLSLTARLLQYETKHKALDAIQVSEIQAKIDELSQDIRIAELDDNLKISVLRYLQKIAQALDEYFISGAVPILDAVNASFGNVLTDPKYEEFVKSQSTLSQRFTALLDNVATATTIAVNLDKIGPAISVAWKVLTN